MHGERRLAMPERMKPKPVVKLIVPTVRSTHSGYDDPEAEAYDAEKEAKDAPDRKDT